MADDDRTERGLVCPCGSIDIYVMYSCPLQFRCNTCKRKLVDHNDKGIPYLTREQAQSKRPGMYGLPTCDQCSHEPHKGYCKTDCRWCVAINTPHTYKMRYAT